MDGRLVPLAAAKPRALLAFLLLNRNRVVSTDALIDALWDDPPETAAKALQGYVSQLRRALGPDRLATRAPGYVLRVDPSELDLDSFESLASAGRRALEEGRPEEASRSLRSGLDLWRGEPLAGIGEPFAVSHRRALEESRLGAIEAWADAELALGRHDPLVGALERIIADEPYRERPRAQLMLALYRSGRQADALEVYRQTRRTLAEELGIEPGKELQTLEQAILRHDSSLDRPRAATPPRPAEGPGRRRTSLRAAVAVALAAAAAAAVAVVVGSRGSSSAPLRPFVTKVENFLVQSRDGRREVAQAIREAGRCGSRRPAALVRLARVQRNRQSLLNQIAALTVPDDAGARRVSDELQQAIQRSIAADGLYSDWLRAARGCPLRGGGPDLAGAHRADVRATAAKRAFVRDFNTLARRFGQEVWSAAEI